MKARWALVAAVSWVSFVVGCSSAAPPEEGSNLIVGGGGGGTCGQLTQGGTIGSGQTLFSCDGRFHLDMQSDGNLVLYDQFGARWASSTVGKGGAYATMQSDGNFVIYRLDHQPVWATHTSGHPGSRFAVQNDGNLVVYSGTKAIWASNTCCVPETPGAWPNASSGANSDPWIAQHHDSITQMQPRVLAINFAVSQTKDSMTNKMKVIASNLNEGSEYHAYVAKREQTPPPPQFLHYTIGLAVDAVNHADVAWNSQHLNGASYPLKCSSSDGYQFSYAALFNDEFAQLYGVVDPDHPGHVLGLADLVARGIIHEVWIFVDGDPDAYTCANGVKMGDFQLPEVLEFKQKYGANGVALSGQFDSCAGNGCFDADDLAPFWQTQHSLRILYVNSTRGSGAAVHSLGHGLEHTANNGTIPYFSDNFRPFANLDLRSRNLPFDNWYSCDCPNGDCSKWTCLNYTGVNSLNYDLSPNAGPQGVLSPYNQGCGNVHFPPNARNSYDDANTFAVDSTCEHYGMHDGPNGADLQRPTSVSDWSMYNADAQNENTGGWNIYWRQSFPGYGNTARGKDGKPMKNWWPFLFY